MNKIFTNSLRLKMIGVFAGVILLALALFLGLFFALSQGEFERYVMDNSTAVGRVVRQSLSEGAVQPSEFQPKPGPDQIIAITVPLQDAIQETTTVESTRFLTKIRQAALGAVGLAAVLAFIAGTLLFQRITRPLAGLQAAAHTLGSGEMSVRIPVTTSDEIGQVSRAFNRMASQLEEQENLRRRMVADVAHELRTPLSVIRSNLEAMIDGLIPSERDELDEIHSEVMRLTRLTEDLRLLSLADVGQLRLDNSHVDIGDLIETIVRGMTPAALSKEIVLEGDIQGVSASLIGDRNKLKQALINLVDNGIRYTPAGGRVLVKARHRDDSVFIAVLDNGPGISSSDQRHLFERFWRADESRGSAQGGSGLGLAIVKEIVELHSGTIRHDTPPGGGSRFTILLPVLPSEV